jgi:hypothetical protein
MSRITGWLLGLVMVVPALGSQFWVEYDPSKNGGKLPEEVGWQRFVYAGGAERWFEDGALVIDGLASSQIADDYWMPTPLELGPQECFLMEWGVRVTMGSGFADPLVAVDAADQGIVILRYQQDWIYSLVENVWIQFEGGAYHEYTITSMDMQTYALYIDSQLAHVGTFETQSPDWGVTWGDGTIGASSLSEWHYVRYGIVPIPMTGDVNCDGTVDFRDINPFVQALTDQMDYKDTYPGCWLENADVNADGSVDFGDINPFIELLIP